MALTLQRDGDGKQRIAMEKIGGAVEGVDDPAVGFVDASDLAAFLHQKAIAGAGVGKFIENDLFGAVVGGGYEVRRPLDGNLQVFNLAEVSR